MAPKSIKMAITAALEDLVGGNLEKFCEQLLDHRTQLVRRSWVMGKSPVQISSVLVETYTEEGALEVALETLRDAGFEQTAKKLVGATKNLTSSKPTTSSTAEASGGGAAGGSTNITNKHFIDEHRLTLIRRVTNLDPILDELQDKVIDSAVYNKIRAKDTDEEKMRAILDGPMKGGKECKDILYEILERHEKFLMAELKNE